MKRSLSLRLRLTLIILIPLLSIAVLAGLWQLGNARRTADDVFDRAMLLAALAVANDVAISGGDALSARTRDTLSDTSGGRVFYNVYAPDGVIVAGYATPPSGAVGGLLADDAPAYFDGNYLGRAIRGVRIRTQAEVDGFAGRFTTTVWQDSALRARFVRDLIMRTVIAISSLIATVALIVWFGVRLGLRPLADLEAAIAQRSSDDLAPIRRPVPEEVAGVVATLNRLLGQVSDTMTARSEFIANAAHQLKNPIAGIMALAESVVSAPSGEKAKARASELLAATQDAADLSSKLLMLERADALAQVARFAPVDLTNLLPVWAAVRHADGIDVAVRVPEQPLVIMGDEVTLREAVTNLIDNALRHGGEALSMVTVSVEPVDDEAVITVADDGRGMDAGDAQRARERFVQLTESGSSGLGLSIVEAIVSGHGGRLRLSDNAPGLRVDMILPVHGTH